ncbi:Zinc finger, RING-type domain and Zinc finger, RING/FYVE/PHD-type domain-containing protein [Strongyloides ratti]|uniref:Zinc finger, RING-type domain and Zinc finger, RING/FYVE/PHD-type domain-containing protein n=1 Tax=Strongyloides ratti TaxID=34506 RepID=A0A090L4R4_STRRB|nr:Zinc finger, RING-type domain and Zinc finger, RING/FYVE/PHD-type domain-containing protein [Strongyloides ratti]CEF64781.1 Zinc finger, RING-type domain and Zinc finger, RING/FYVE/PHD-type domain-containing protein [Strongyloides ratti]
MPFLCSICSLLFTNPGTEHSMYSTMCGHIVGKSCIEKLKSSKSFNNFKCPICCKKLGRMAYHPILNMPNEISDIVINPVQKYLKNNYDTMECSFENNKNYDGTFILKFNESINGTIELFDVYNGCILINGFNLPNSDNLQYLALLIKNDICTAIAFNKCRDDVIEFCIGSDKGEIFHAIIGLDFKIILEKILIQEKEKIDSICFLEKNKIAYSFGKGNLFVCNTNNILEKENWTKFNFSEGGKINNKLYIFQNSEYSNEFCSSYYSGNRELITYNVDSGIIFALYNERNMVSDENTLSKSYILRKIKGIYLENNKYNKEIEYITCILKEKDFPRFFKSKLIVIKNEEYPIIFTFIPNIKKNVIQAFILKSNTNNNTELFLVAEKFIEDLNTCLGICIVKEPKIYLSKFMKVKLILFLKNKYISLDFVCALPDKLKIS